MLIPRLGTWPKRHQRPRPIARAASSAVGISHAVHPYCSRLPAAFEISRLRGGLRGRRGKPHPDWDQRQHRRVHRRTDLKASAGFITPPKEYFKIVFSIVKKYGALLSLRRSAKRAGGRTGQNMVWHRELGSYPRHDTSARKGMGKRCADRLDGDHAGNRRQFPGLEHSHVRRQSRDERGGPATIELIEEENLLENADVVGKYFRES